MLTGSYLSDPGCILSELSVPVHRYPRTEHFLKFIGFNAATNKTR